VGRHPQWKNWLAMNWTWLAGAEDGWNMTDQGWNGR